MWKTRIRRSPGVLHTDHDEYLESFERDGMQTTDAGLKDVKKVFQNFKSLFKKQPVDVDKKVRELRSDFKKHVSSTSSTEMLTEFLDNLKIFENIVNDVEDGSENIQNHKTAAETIYGALRIMHEEITESLNRVRMGTEWDSMEAIKAKLEVLMNTLYRKYSDVDPQRRDTDKEMKQQRQQRASDYKAAKKLMHLAGSIGSSAAKKKKWTGS